MNRKLIILSLFACVALVALSGVASAEQSDKEWSFEQDLNESWNIISEQGGPFSRNTSYHTDGFYSLAWSDTGGDYSNSRIRTKDVGFANPEYTKLTFDYYEHAPGGEDNADEMRVRLVTPERTVILFGHIPFSNVIFVSGDSVDYVEAGNPPPNQWNNVEVRIEGKQVVTHVNNVTLRTNISEPIQNPNDVKLRMTFYQSGFDSEGTTYFIDNMAVTTTAPGLTALQTPDIAVIGVFLVVILFAAVRLRSPATVVSWVLLALAAIGILAFDVDFLIFWIASLVAIITVAISGIVYYAER